MHLFSEDIFKKGFRLLEMRTFSAQGGSGESSFINEGMRINALKAKMM